MQRLPKGLENAVYVAQKAALLTYSNANLEIFLQEKQLKKGTAQFPFYDVNEFLLIYLNDLCIFSPKGIENADKVHLFLVEFLPFCTIKLVYKMAKNKVQLFPASFKFWGHYFETDKN